MKKFMTALAALLIMTVSAKAMSYEQARQQALFLTDKMAYELNLTDDQYEAAYEINLDYLMGVNTYDDLYGTYWTRRNLDLSYILLDWQYRAFCDAAYFYRPLYWSGGYWHFGIYARYPHRDYFFFDRPHVYVGYRGGHSWVSNGGRSWYKGRDFGRSNGNRHFGMRDGFDRGDYGRGRTATMGNRNSLQQRNQSDRNGQFGTRNGSFGNRNNGTGNNGNGMGNRDKGTTTQRNGSFGNRGAINQRNDNALQRNDNASQRGTFNSRGSSTFNSRGSSTRTTVNRPSGENRSSFGSSRSADRSANRTTTSTPRNTFSPSRSSNSGSFGGSRSSSVGRSSSPSSSHGASAPSHSGGGGHSGGGSFGGRR